MKQHIILPVLAIMAVTTGCSDDDRVFDTSAAARTEQSRNEYMSALTADGGKWAMEYFTTDEEPGYLMVVNFRPDGSVEFHADHKWIGGEYDSEVSLWDVISDNSSVLTFNSYNSLFHIFSSPENITGPDAPKGPDGQDITEVGFGHNGDYEFKLMEHGAGSLHMIGKKHGRDIWMRHLPADVDEREYLASIIEKTDVFSPKFPTLVMTEGNGNAYNVTALPTAIPTIVPRSTDEAEADEVTQAVTGNAVFTATGMRFQRPLEVIRLDNSRFTVQEFVWADDGALQCGDVRICAPKATENLTRTGLAWVIPAGALSAGLETMYRQANADLTAHDNNSRRTITDISLAYSMRDGKTILGLVTKIGRRICTDYLTLTAGDNDGEITLTLDGSDPASTHYNDAVPSYLAFKKALLGKFNATNKSQLDASAIDMTSLTDADISYSLNVR